MILARSIHYLENWFSKYVVSPELEVYRLSTEIKFYDKEITVRNTFQMIKNGEK